MTPPRLALLALAALAATGGALWLSSQRHLERAVGVGEPVLPQLRAAINDVAQLRLSRGDGALVTLRRGEQGWNVVERGWNADAGKVRKLLLDLSALAIVEEKTHDPARYPVLGVEDVAGPTAAGTRLDVKTAQGAIHSLIVGKTSGARESYVRAVGAAPSYLASPQIAVETVPARWLDTALLDVAAAEVRAVTVQPRGRPARTFEGPQLTPELAGALAGLTLEDVRVRALESSGGPPAAPAAARLSYVTWDGLTLELEGREDGARRWISVAAAFDAAAARPRPTPPSAAATPDAAAIAAATPDATSPVAADVATSAAAAPEAGALSDTGRGAANTDPKARAAAIAQRTAGREFEIPAYRYATLFGGDAPAASAAPRPAD